MTRRSPYRYAWTGWAMLLILVAAVVLTLSTGLAHASVLPSGRPTGTVPGGNPLAPPHPPTGVSHGSPTSTASATPTASVSGLPPVLSTGTAKPATGHTAARVDNRLPAQLAHTGGVPWMLVLIAVVLIAGGAIPIIGAGIVNRRSRRH